MRSELTPDEVDHVMANIYPEYRRWCPASCGPAPGDDLEFLSGFACACTGCIHGNLSWEEFAAWKERESHRAQTPYIGWPEDQPALPPPTLADRLAAYKARKRS